MTDSSMEDFIIEKVLGKGSFGSVYLVRRKEDNKIYALKSVILEKLNKKEQQNSVNEVRILASVNHPNVIGYKEAFWDDKVSSLNIVMEYADDGDLQTKIGKMRKEGGMFQEKLIWSYSIQMIEGLKALHDKKIMHRDLKSANIFLVKDKHQCKLGDMNVSKVIKEKELLTQTGTPYYASPEVWRDEPYSYKSDLWSIGCVIYELCALRPPFKGKDLDELFMNVCKGKVDRISHIYSDDLWKMILMLLQVDVEKRCDCDKFLNSKLITKKIEEMKNENKDYKNLEKNKEINDNDLLLDTIRFDNILDIKRQLPTKKNYGNNNNSSNRNINKKIVKKNMNLNINTKVKNNKKHNVNLMDYSNSIKYRKINNKNRNKKINYNKNNIDNEQNIEKDNEKEKENVKEKEKIDKKNIDLNSDIPIRNQNQSSIQLQENENSINNNTIKEYLNNSSLKNTIFKKNKYIKNSPNGNKGKSLIYKKPKLLESIKREKKDIFLNAQNQSMTTKRTNRKIDYMERNITPKKVVNKFTNKIENNSFSLKNKNNIYKSVHASINREKTQRCLSRPIISSPTLDYNTNINNEVFMSDIKKKNYVKNLNINQRPQSAIPSKKYVKINNSEINLNLDDNIIISNNNINTETNLNDDDFINNGENVVNNLINKYNKRNINFNSYNPNNNQYYCIKRPFTTTNNPKNYMKCQTLNNLEMKNSKKLSMPYNKINKLQSRGKDNYIKKRVIEKNYDREMAESELLKIVNPLKENEEMKECQGTLNISLNNQEQNTFLHQQKGNKMVRYITNNDPRYNQYYSNNVNNSNPQIFNSYVSINNLVSPNFPVKVINVFGK